MLITPKEENRANKNIRQHPAFATLTFFLFEWKPRNPAYIGISIHMQHQITVQLINSYRVVLTLFNY